MTPTRFPVVAELFINGAWVDVTSRVRRFPPSIRRGRSDESSDVQPTTTTIVLNNDDGYLTPGNANSPWYLAVKRGLLVRIGVRAGTQSLSLSGLSGSRAATPDNAALDVTGDIFGAVELYGPPILDGGDTRVGVVHKYVESGNQRSWHMNYNANQTVTLFWSNDGTAVLQASSTVGLPIRSAGPIAWAWYLDVNVAGTSKTVTFYAAESIDEILADPAGTVLGTPVTTASTTSVFSSTAPLEIGDLLGTTSPAFAGRVRRFQFRSGDSTGSIVANPSFYTQTVGTTSFTDSAGRVWTLTGDAAVTDKQYRFVGAVDSISLDWLKATRRDSPDEGVCNAIVTLSGPLRRMQQGASALNSTLRRLVSSPSKHTSVISYWPMEDGSDASSMASGLPGGRNMGQKAMAMASDSTLAASSPLPHLSDGDFGGWEGKVAVSTATQFRVDLFCRIDTPSVSPASEIVMGVITTGTGTRWILAVDSNTYDMDVTDEDGTSVETVSQSSDSRMFDTWTIWSIDMQQNGGNVDWTIDIVPLNQDGTTFGTSGSFAGTLGRITKITNVQTITAADGISFGHAIVSTGEVNGWLAGADTAWVDETAGHRFYRLCTEENLPSLVVGDQGLNVGIRGDNTYSVLMGPQRPETLVDLLRDCASTDGGILFERRDSNSLAFRTRRSFENQTARLTLDANMQGVARPFEPVHDDQRLRNDVTVSRPEGSFAQAVDNDSILDEGRYATDLELNVVDDLHLADHAGWRLHMGTWPGMRYPSIATGLLTAGTFTLNQWLSTDLGDKISVSGLMAQHEDELEQLLEGYDEELSFFKWDITMVGSAAGPWDVGIREDDEAGKRDTAGTELAALVATTDTAALVTVTLGPLWTSAAGDFPFDLNIGGERMTATGQTIFLGFYTFTGLVRSVNGVLKAHPVGTPVKLWRPTIRALR